MEKGRQLTTEDILKLPERRYVWVESAYYKQNGELMFMEHICGGKISLMNKYNSYYSEDTFNNLEVFELPDNDDDIYQMYNFTRLEIALATDICIMKDLPINVENITSILYEVKHKL